MANNRALRVVETVIARGNCSGCGACAALLDGLEMGRDATGFNRPIRRAGDSRPPSRQVSAAEMREICPGATTRAVHAPGVPRHAFLGPVVGAWEAWASDPGVRSSGSSGGVLTALVEWLLENDAADVAVGAAADPQDPAATITVVRRKGSTFLDTAGSRYGPASNAEAQEAYRPRAVFVGKPCESYAVRSALRERAVEDQPLLLSFFCAGVPSQEATTALVRQLGLGDAPIQSLRYRGNGWPGLFTVDDVAGRRASVSYEESWGEHLGRRLQWRCKICPDGVGESADIAAGDFWYAGDDGRPAFAERPGRSALVARTARGRAVIEQAIRAGVIVAETVSPDSIAAVQPYQVRRRQTLAGRLVGSALAGRRPPTYRGFSLIRLSFAAPLRTLHALIGGLARGFTGGGRSG